MARTYESLVTLEDEAVVSYEYDPGQPWTRNQPAIAPSVTVTRVESPKLPGVNLLPLMGRSEQNALAAEILQHEEEAEVAHG